MHVKPSWSNQDLLLFHGTDLPSATNILINGVDVNYSDLIPRKLFRDFGQGFYCTTVKAQALEWATIKGQINSTPPALIAVSAPREKLAALTTLSFVLGTVDALDYWRLVQFCRNGGEAHGVGPDGSRMT